MMTAINRCFHGAMLTVTLSMITACGSGSGASTSENPATQTAVASNYTGPAPATADVQAFKLYVWDNLSPDNRCGACHRDDQAPRFVRADDVNLAYTAANSIVDLTDPGASRMVTKVREGHNCWLSGCGRLWRYHRVVHIQLGRRRRAGRRHRGRAGSAGTGGSWRKP